MPLSCPARAHPSLSGTVTVGIGRTVRKTPTLFIYARAREAARMRGPTVGQRRARAGLQTRPPRPPARETWPVRQPHRRAPPEFRASSWPGPILPSPAAPNSCSHPPGTRPPFESVAPPRVQQDSRRAPDSYDRPSSTADCHICDCGPEPARRCLPLKPGARRLPNARDVTPGQRAGSLLCRHRMGLAPTGRRLQ